MEKRLLTLDEMRAIVRQRCAEAGSIQKYANKLGVDKRCLTYILYDNGRKTRRPRTLQVGEYAAELVGFRVVVSYELATE